MSTVVATELQDFTLFLESKLKAGETQLSPEEALDLWRETHRTNEEIEDDVRAIQESIDEVNAGAKLITGEESVRLLRDMIRSAKV